MSVSLYKIYEDEEVEVYKAPTEEELETMILKVIKEKGRPLSWKELRQVFSGTAGEDRLRRVLIKLIENNRLIELPDGTFAIPGMEQDYIPRSDTKRVRPLVGSKFKELWGPYASRLRKAGIPLKEALKQLGIVRQEVIKREKHEESESEEVEFSNEIT